MLVFFEALFTVAGVEVIAPALSSQTHKTDFSSVVAFRSDTATGRAVGVINAAHLPIAGVCMAIAIGPAGHASMTRMTKQE